MTHQGDHRAICTIVTKSHIKYAKAMFGSVKQFTEVDCHLLIVDSELSENSDVFNALYLSDLGRIELAEIIIAKYKEDLDAMRWSLKSILLQYLLEKGYDQVIFTDPDTFYYSDTAFLFEALQKYGILLSPHWRSNGDLRNNDHPDGRFNAGFVGASHDGIGALKWWASACLTNCSIDHSKGIHHDQKYLETLEQSFDGVGVIEHRGCNVAHWNQSECQRKIVDNEVLINGKYPIVFVHFTHSTLRGIVWGLDRNLVEHLKMYQSALQNIDPLHPNVFDHLRDAGPESKGGIYGLLQQWKVKLWRMRQATSRKIGVH